MNDPTNDLRQSLGGFRVNARMRLLDVLDSILTNTGQTCDGIATGLGETPQNLHPQLKRLLCSKLIHRHKQIGDTDRLGRTKPVYVYAAASWVSIHDVNLLRIETNEAKSNPTSKPKSKEHIVSQFDPRQSSAISTRNLLIQKLPDFDPEWSEDVQKSWFAAFEKVMEEIKYFDRIDLAKPSRDCGDHGATA